MDFLLDVKKVLEPFFDSWIRGDKFEKDVSFLKVSGGIVKFEVVDREDVIGDEVVDEGEHVDRMKSLRTS